MQVLFLLRVRGFDLACPEGRRGGEAAAIYIGIIITSFIKGGQSRASYQAGSKGLGLSEVWGRGLELYQSDDVAIRWT